MDLTKLDPKIFAATANALTGVWTWKHGPKRTESAELDWVIVGGESGRHARPMHPDWARALRDQCVAAGVLFFFKQWGEWVVPYDGARACRVCGCTDLWACDDGCFWVEPDLCSSCEGEPTPAERAVKFHRVGKRAAGRVLDGRTWDEMPAGNVG